ncbi:hypothetical protein K1T71_014472 [Dendrolimus kikuchii]|uniref:Uncharacterized protein n=1 Tax=Dendrolimus kikuchii TaxID=765133 RepID=A0ACC1CEG0_9NEOP|nr:hypothetical protein K1T71_014472 [Dendrolimus kikuchii]
MLSLSALLYLFSFVNVVFMQGTGSGTNGNLRLCIVEGRGEYKRAPKFCPILDKENAGVECVVGTDRLDCLRRISKGTVDFGVFSPEDLIAAQWANIDVLVTSELRLRSRPFQRRIVAVVNRRILPDTSSNLHAVLQNSTLCHPGVGVDDIRPLSDTLSGYLESLVLVNSCDRKLSLTENRVRALAGFFGSACKAGPWVSDPTRDAELKHKYPSLCTACRYPSTCAASDPYWGNSGALACLGEGAGDVAWAEMDDVISYFGLSPQKRTNSEIRHFSTANLAYLCRNGTWEPVENNTEPCIWLNRPWDVIVAKRKVASAVSHLTSMLSEDTSLDGWRGALESLLETRHGLPTTLEPPQPPLDYLARAKGFREAYTQNGCDPPRHITLCTTSLLAKNKCEWLSEAGAVYGLAPPFQCIMRNNTSECMEAIGTQEADITVADSEWLVPAVRDYNLTPILFEATPIIEKTHSVVAYVKNNTGIVTLPHLKGKRAAFPMYDGVAWHGVREYLMHKEKVSCKDVDNYFKEVCAPGVISTNPNIKSCYPNGEVEALQSLVSGKSDVAFVSISTFNMVAGNKDNMAEDFKNIIPICPADNKKYCFITWSNIGHVYASKNATAMRKQEIINVLSKMDHMFGKHSVFQYPMFSLYGPYSHEMNVIFHNNTKVLGQSNLFKMHPYNKLGWNFEKQILNVTDFTCAFGGRVTPSLILIVTLVSVLFKNY